MSCPEAEPMSAHLACTSVSLFLILYALFSELIRNHAHLSECPLAALTGIAFGPRGTTILDPFSWGFEDNITQEFKRIIMGVQVSAVGIGLSPGYMKRHCKGILLLLGPNMFSLTLPMACRKSMKQSARSGRSSLSLYYHGAWLLGRSYEHYWSFLES